MPRKCFSFFFKILILMELLPSIFLPLIVCRIGGGQAGREQKIPLCKFKIYDHYIDTETFPCGNLWSNFEWLELVTTALHRFKSAYKRKLACIKTEFKS